MLGRALGFAALAIAVCFSVQTPAQAQNLEAGKSPAQIFNGACTVCHKSPRGLVKSVPPGSLPGFLRQHYTTSSDMAGALSSYLLANGGVDRRPSAERPRRGREAKPSAAVREPAPTPAQNSWWPFRREPAVQSSAPGGAEQHSGRKSSTKHRKKSKAAKSKSHHQEDAPQQPSHSAAGSEKAKSENASSPAPKSEPANSAPAQRTDPVPAVTSPAEPKSSESKSSEPSSDSPHTSEPKLSEPKTSEPKPPDSKAD